MKIFVVYAKVELTQKPTWLDSFRVKYDKPYEYHITLKQPCIIGDNQVLDIKAKLNDLFSNLKILNNAISLTFDSLKVSKAEQIYVMINATNVDEITQLQKNVVSTLHEYDKYQKTKYKEYEENFEPHITIARDLDEQSYLSAAKELQQDYTCKGIIKEVVLAVVDSATVSEVNNPDNQTLYTFH